MRPKRCRLFCHRRSSSLNGTQGQRWALWTGQFDSHLYHRPGNGSPSGLRGDVRQEPKMPRLDNLPKTRGGEPWDSIFRIATHHTQRSATFGRPLGCTWASSDHHLTYWRLNTEDLDFSKINEISLLKEKSYKAHVFIRITSNMLRPTVRVFNTGYRQSLVLHSSFQKSRATASTPSTTCLQSLLRIRLSTS